MGFGFLSLRKYSFHSAQEFLHLRRLDNERRQESQRGFVRAVNQHSALQRFGNVRRAIHAELQANDQALAANFLNEIKLLREQRKPFAEFGAARADVRQQILIFNHIQEFESRGAGQRPAAKCGAVHARRKCFGESFSRQHCSKRYSAGQRLGHHDDVGRPGKFLVCEFAPRAPKSALDFIGDQRGVMLRRQVRARAAKMFR